MGDYDLSRLSTRSFEQLIQALAAKIIGPNVVIFGDGADGGREATFDGRIPYPADKDNAWQGYGVVQAKFRQRPTKDADKDGEWALKQLREELGKFVDPEKKLRKPNYYIFATNVVLTPVEGTGSKDKADQLIREFKDDLPLEDYDIWDYDKICRFLDDCEGIRQSYAAWITPGDVLAKVIEWLKPQKPDFESIITNFLQKELLADQYANLEQAGHAADDRIPLANVFIDLPTFDERRLDPQDDRDRTTAFVLPDEIEEEQNSGFIAEVLKAAAARLDPESASIDAGHKRGQFELLSNRQQGKFVLMGGPGQGKTTIGQFICQLFRAAILSERNIRDSEVRRALSQIDKQCCRTGLQLPDVPRFPIQIVLNDFAAKLASKENGHINSLLSYIVDRIQKRTDREISPEDFRQWLAAYPWIIILDGLDEVPPASNRDDVLAAVQNFWVDANDCNADICVIATSRPQGYDNDYSPVIYRHKWLAALSPKHAMRYGRLLAQVRYGNNRDRFEKVVERLQRAANHEATARLMRSPLQVTIMTTLVDQMGQPPQERWRLFKDYYEVIYKREVERDIPASNVLRDFKPDIDTIHNHVGLLLQVESDRSGQTNARFPSDRFAALVEARLTEEGYQGVELGDLKERIMEAATHRLVFLVGVEEGQVGFEIRSLQEFMAAEGLMAGEDKIVRERLREIAPIVSWRNAFLFAAGKCFAERQYLRDTIYTICAELNDDTEVNRVTLAGSQLALDLLEDGPAQRQPKYSQSLTRLALRLLDLPPNSPLIGANAYHSRLADLYGPRLEQVYREELKDHLDRKNPEDQLGAWATLIPLTDANVLWAKGMADACWPGGDREQSRILRLAIQSRDGSWLVSRKLNFLPCVSPRDLLRHVASISDRIESIEKPAWLEVLVDFIDPRPLSGPRIYFRFPEVEGEVFGFSIAMISDSQKDRWALLKDLLKDLPNPHPGWIPQIAAVRFSADPSKTMLAQALRTIAEETVTEDFRQVDIGALWPLAACVAACSDRDDLLEMASRAEAGELGDVPDWLAAEKRWATHGITIDDIDYMTDERWPFDKEIAQFGFPFSGAGIGLNLTGPISIQNQLVQTFINIHAQQEKSHIRSRIAHWTLFTLEAFLKARSDQEKKKTIGHQMRFDQFRTMILEEDYFGMRMLTELEWEDVPESKWIDLFDDLGKQECAIRLYFRYPPKGELVSLLSETFCNDRSRVGILRFLGYIAREGIRLSIPANLLDPELYSDPKLREAAILVRLAQSDYSQDEAGSLVKHLTELREESPYIVKSALDLVEEHCSGGHLVNFCLELRRQLPSTEWEAISRTIRALNDFLRRQTGRLEDPRVWSALGLPESLHGLLY